MAEEIEVPKPEEEKSIPEKINEIYIAIKPLDKKKLEKKVKEWKVPSKGKVSNGKVMKGWVTIEKIHENRNIEFEKQKVEMQVYQTKDGIYHSTDGREIYFYKGKPFLHQPVWRQNPHDPLKEINPDRANNVYGQKPILAAMQAGVYKEAKKGGSISGIVWIIVIAIAGYIIYNLITKGRFF